MSAPEFSYPLELVPEKIVSGNVEFLLSVKSDFNSVACSGQKIMFVQNCFTRLSLLAAADQDVDALFEFIGGEIGTVKVRVPARSGFIGQYDTRTWKRKSRWKYRDYFWHIKNTGLVPGFVKRTPLAFFTTHTHLYNTDNPYSFGYVFHLDLEIPSGAAGIFLCRDERVHVFAAVLSRNDVSATNCLFLKDTFDY